jgi:dihydrolipoamide dehydrogenase
VVPRVTFAEPEIASVGVTEPEARQSGYEVTVRRHDFATQSRALMMGELRGFVKVVLDARSEEILGGHIIGPRAGGVDPRDRRSDEERSAIFANLRDDPRLPHPG